MGSRRGIFERASQRSGWIHSKTSESHLKLARYAALRPSSGQPICHLSDFFVVFVVEIVVVVVLMASWQR